MNVSIVIPTYNGLNLLKKNLPEVIKCMRHRDELVIVDDVSNDKSVEWLVKKFKLIEKAKNHYQGIYKRQGLEYALNVVINEKNQRFAKTANHGVNKSSHPIIFLLNNDVSPHKDVIEKVIHYFKDDAVFGVGVLEKEANFQLDEPKYIQGGKNLLWFEKGIFFHSRAKNFDSGETAWVSGGSGFFDKQKWRHLGGFDLKYFPAYWEDIDLSFRARKKGWKVLFVAEAFVYHNHESTNSTVFGQRKINEIGWKNSDYFTWKNGDFWQKIAFIIWRPYWFWKRFRAKQK